MFISNSSRAVEKYRKYKRKKIDLCQCSEEELKERTRQGLEEPGSQNCNKRTWKSIDRVN